MIHQQTRETNQHGEPCNCHDRLAEWCPVHRDEHPGAAWNVLGGGPLGGDGSEGWG